MITPRRGGRRFQAEVSEGDGIVGVEQVELRGIVAIEFELHQFEELCLVAVLAYLCDSAK